MDVKIKKMFPFVLGVLLSVSAFAEVSTRVDASQYTLRQVQNGLNRSGFFSKKDLNDAKLLQEALNEFGLKELNTLITKGVNPNPDDPYIAALLENKSIDPKRSETVALYFNAEDEPVSNPILGEVLSIIFENGSAVKVGDSFRVDIDVDTQERSEALAMKLTVKKEGEWLFNITELELYSKDKFARDPDSLLALALNDFLEAYFALNYVHALGHGAVAALGTGSVFLIPLAYWDSPELLLSVSTLGGVLGFIHGAIYDVHDQLNDHGQRLTPSVRQKLTLLVFVGKFAYDFMKDHYPYWVSYLGYYFGSDTATAHEEL